MTLENKPDPQTSVASRVLRAHLEIVLLIVVLPLTALAAKPNDVRPGMTAEEATKVAISCIQAASRMKTKDIRLQDTLAFVGINDEMRVDALKRHIVRNPNIGVPSISTTFNGQSLTYLILNDQLSGIGTKWTVAKLAQTISEKAGIVRLTYARAASIIAACRGNTAKIPADTRISTDSGVPGNFVACLAGRDKGVGSAGVSDPTGRDYVYRIDAGALQNGIDGGWTYADLIKYIADNASVSNLPRAYGGN